MYLTSYLPSRIFQLKAVSWGAVLLDLLSGGETVALTEGWSSSQQHQAGGRGPAWEHKPDKDDY